MPTTDADDNRPRQRRPPTRPPSPRATTGLLQLRRPRLVALDAKNEQAALAALAVLLESPDQAL